MILPFKLFWKESKIILSYFAGYYKMIWSIRLLKCLDAALDAAALWIWSFGGVGTRSIDAFS